MGQSAPVLGSCVLRKFLSYPLLLVLSLGYRAGKFTPLASGNRQSVFLHLAEKKRECAKKPVTDPYSVLANRQHAVIVNGKK